MLAARSGSPLLLSLRRLLRLCLGARLRRRGGLSRSVGRKRRQLQALVRLPDHGQILWILLGDALELLLRIRLALHQREPGCLVVGARGNAHLAELLERGPRLVELALRLERVAERLLGKRTQRVVLARAGEEFLQVLLRGRRISRLQLVEAELGERRLSRSRASVVGADLLQRGDHRLLALFLAREGLLAGLRLRIAGDRTRQQLERFRELGARLGLPRFAPGRDPPGGQHHGHHRRGQAQHQALVRGHPAHRATRYHLEFVRPLQLLAIDLLRHELPPAGRAFLAELPCEVNRRVRYSPCASSQCSCWRFRQPRDRSGPELPACSSGSKDCLESRPPGWAHEVEQVWALPGGSRISSRWSATRGSGRRRTAGSARWRWARS